MFKRTVCSVAVQRFVGLFWFPFVFESLYNPAIFPQVFSLLFRNQSVQCSFPQSVLDLLIIETGWCDAGAFLIALARPEYPGDPSGRCIYNEFRGNAVIEASLCSGPSVTGAWVTTESRFHWFFRFHIVEQGSDRMAFSTMVGSLLFFHDAKI